MKYELYVNMKYNGKQYSGHCQHNDTLKYVP